MLLAAGSKLAPDSRILRIQQSWCWNWETGLKSAPFGSCVAFGFLIHKAGWKRILNCTPFQHGRFAKVTCWNSIVEVEPPLDVFGLRAFNYSKIMDCFITRLSFGLRAFGAGSAEEVEAQACREGLTLAAEWTSGPIILESDCAAVVSYLVNPTSQRSASYSVIREALEV